jgi:hypothetical protein
VKVTFLHTALIHSLPAIVSFDVWVTDTSFNKP